MFNKYLLPILSILMFFFILSLSYGYATFNEDLSISGDAIVRIEKDIRIIDYRLLNSSNGSIENYNAKYSVNTISNSITLPNKDSSITYEVTIKNDTKYAYKIDNITSLSHSNRSIEYNILDYKEDTYIEANSNLKLRIKYVYNENSYDKENTTLQSMIKFNYKKMGYVKVSYAKIESDGLPKSALINTSFNVKLDNSEEDLLIYMNNKKLNKNEYTYQNGILSIKKVTGDIEIVNNEGLKVSFNKNSWRNEEYYYYQYDITINNPGVKDVNGWILSFDVPDDLEVVGLWGPTYKIINGALIITNNKSQATISAGTSVSFSLQVRTKDENFKIDEIDINRNIIGNISNTAVYNGDKTDGLDISFDLENYWGVVGDYYLQFSINISNNTNDKINDWYIRFSIPNGASIEEYWNVNVIEESNNKILLTSTGHNDEIISNSTITAGIIIRCSDLNFIPGK